MISRSYPDSEGCYKVKVQILNWSTADRSIEFKYARLYRRHWDGSEDPLQNTYPNPKLDPEEWTQNSCNSVSIGGPSTSQTTPVAEGPGGKFDSNLSCTSETPMHTFSMIVNNNSSSSSSAKKQLLTQIPDFHFNSDISQDVWELQIFDESEEHVLNSERNAEIKMQQQLQSNQIQDRPGPGSMTKRANSGLSLLGPDGIPLDLEIPTSECTNQQNENLNTTQQTAPRTPNRYSQQSKNQNGVTVQAIQPICWLPICLGALEDLYRFPEGTEQTSSGQQQENQQMILNGTNVTGIMSGGGSSSDQGANNSSSSSDTNLEEIKKRPITWRGWLPLAFWQEQKSMEQRNETRTTRECAERFFLDCVANHFCSQNAGGGGGGLGGGGGGGVVYPKIDIRFSLVWYPESLEHQFLIKRLSADRQKYQLGTVDHIDYTHNLYVKWMQGEMQYQKEQSNINDNNNQEQQNQNNMHLIGTNLRIGSIGGGSLGNFNSTSLLSNSTVSGQQYQQAQQVSNIKTQQQTLKYNYSIPTSQNLWATNNQVQNQTSQYNTNQQYQQSNSLSQILTQQQYSNGYNTNIGSHGPVPRLTGSIQRYQLAAPTSTTTPNVYGMTPGPTLSNFASILTPGAVSNFGSGLSQQQNLHSRQYVQSQQQSMLHNTNNNSNQNLNQSQSQSLMGSNISNVNQGYNINSNTMGLSSSMAQGTITSGTTSLCQSNADLNDSQSQVTGSVTTVTQTNTNSTYQTLQIPTHNSSIHSMNIFGSSPMATLTPSGRFSSSNTIGLARSGSKQ